ncbi:MAG: signal recognition particle protein [Clostridia bacterium]|nr:signal recognition particle protein [Clostridia bacterium]MBQ5957009.1 signal recognition particle protein [Clostridia bacterium]
MAFEGLAEKLQNVFSKLTRKGKLTEADIKASMREVRLALLEADVNYTVAKKFVQNVSEKAVGEQVLNSLTPGQQVIKIVRDELTEILGGTRTGIQISPKPPTVILMAGLQGAGKTTMCGKLALHFKNEGKRPLLVACDVHRPAAKDQLKIVGKSVNVPVFSLDSDDAPFIASSAIAEASNSFNDIVIVDTAGRLHIDAEMMEELKEIKEKIDPDEVLLVVDAMTGQDAVNAAKAFNEEVELTGVILTKIDGDARGGAALSVKDVTGKPIKFVGTGEKMGDLEPFYPDRMATRILGMGDVLSLIERAEKNIDEKKAMETLERMKSQQFNFNDYLENIEQVRGMGSMQDILGMIPGGNKLKNMEIDEKQFTRIEAIIRSMTKQEREEPSIINGSRRKRIAAGSGVSIQEVNKLISQFDQMKKMMKMMTSKKGRKKGFMGLPF